MNWKELTKQEAEVYYNYNIKNKSIICGIEEDDYRDLKERIYSIFNDVLDELNISKENLSNDTKRYKFDCKFGIKLFSLFSNEPYIFNEREASNASIWRYIQVKIVPDIIVYRWGSEAETRMYSQSNRLYLKTLWWYVYLSYNDNIENTEEIIMDSCNSTDTIVQLTERSGRNGYKLDLYRCIMKLKTKYKLETIEFRKLMVLNSARIKLIIPEYNENGIIGYVESLIKDVRGIE